MKRGMSRVTIPGATPMRTRSLLGLTMLLGLFTFLARTTPVVGQEPKPAAQVKSKIKVTLPEEDAELLIEDKQTKQQGKVREFETPLLKQGDVYTYKFTVKYRPNNYTIITRTKDVSFKAGEDISLDLSKMEPNDRAVIRYVPTPEDIVAQRGQLAGVNKDDVIYEPGCGDARISIACIKAGAKKGVGVDLDPERITESKANVKAAGVEKTLEIRLADALDLKDYGDTTVVMMYMGNEFNALIRPVLWEKLKVGTRIVSHRFTMGDWKPTKTINVKGDDGDEYELHLWVIGEEQKKAAAAAAKDKKEKK